jgi:hypothetical protein
MRLPKTLIEIVVLVAIAAIGIELVKECDPRIISGTVVSKTSNLRVDVVTNILSDRGMRSKHKTAGKYLVMLKDGRVLKIEDSYFSDRNMSQAYDYIGVGETYQFKITGLSVPELSIYPYVRTVYGPLG